MKTPFTKGDRVNIIRTRHGWFDGQLTATVKCVMERRTGTHWYLVTDDDGNDHEIEYSRDMKKCVKI